MDEELPGPEEPAQELSPARESFVDRMVDGARRAKEFILDQRYLVLSGALVLLVVFYLLKHQWAAGIDVWEHAAAARELGANPLDPGHPLFAIDRPHQLLSPYHLALGLVSRFTGLSIFNVLSLASLGNLLLLLVGLRVFTKRLLRRRHVDFYALLFILFLWGPNPWFFSGFLHFNVLPLVLPYASTFAKGLVLLGLAIHLRFLDGNDRRLLAVTALIGAVLFLAHPVDALFFFVGIGALAFTRRPEQWVAHLALTSAAIAASAILALLWPYYSLYDLLFGAANETYRTGLASADRDMYQNVLVRIWPALFAVPFIIRRLLRNPNDALLLMLGGLLLLYAYGWRTEEWAYGRLLSAIMVAVALILAAETARAMEEAAARGSAGRDAARWIQFAVLGLVLVGMFQVRHGFIMLPDFLLRRLPYSAVHSFVDLAPISDYAFLSGYLNPGDVVIANRNIDVAAFGAKVVAVGAPEAFVDQTERGTDLDKFWNKSTSQSVRQEIIDKYDASYLLLSQQAIASEPDRYTPLMELGTAVHSNSRFVLLDLR